MLGLIDEQGRPTDRANDWRSDDHYADVCRQIRDECYPQALRDAFPGPEIDRGAAEQWFSRIGKMGESSAKNVALIFEVLTRADLAGQDSPSPNAGGTTRPGPTGNVPDSRRSGVRPARVAAVSRTQDDASSNVTRRSQTDWTPALHVNVQIHISADASADQIDQIFASMARHLRASSS